MEQIDGPVRTCSPSCEQRDAGREGQGDASARQRGDMGRIKLPQRSDMICGFASLKGQLVCKSVPFATLGWIFFICKCVSSVCEGSTHVSTSTTAFVGKKVP